MKSKSKKVKIFEFKFRTYPDYYISAVFTLKIWTNPDFCDKLTFYYRISNLNHELNFMVRDYV